MSEMNLTDSHKLLRDYADRGDESAFRALVEQYIDLVYSAALRRVNGDASLAQDVTQAVFTDLARKAKSLRQVEMLGGWLHRHTGFVASTMVRTEQRRQIREQEAAQMNATHDSPDSLWQQIAPVLDDTLELLEPPDRQAVLLRFFERRDFRSMGAMLGISDDAAQKRVSRALEKLRTLLTERGVTLSVMILSSLLAGRVVMAAPSGLAATVSGMALSGIAGGGTGLTLLKLSKSLAVKIAIAATIIAAIGWLYLQHKAASYSEMELPPVSAAELAGHVKPSVPDTQTSSPVSAPLPIVETNNSGPTLLLNVVAADSGKPVPNVELDYWTWPNGKVKHNHSLVADRFGVCRVPIPTNTTELSLVSGRDGFADTLLDWRPDHNEQIPNQYTLRLARAVPIGGQVVDPDGNPVAGATVGFNNQADPGVQMRPQSDDFNWPFWETGTTDAQGRWQINRLGKEMIRTIYGNATHPDYVQTPLIFNGRDSEAESQLLAQTSVFKLGHAITIQGTVRNPDGQPIPDADILIGHADMGGSRESKSAIDGTFSIRGCTPGKSTITAQAKGYAATTVPENLSDNSGPFTVVLHPGKLLKLRVVDENGNPMSHVQVWLDTLIDFRVGHSNTTAQVRFNRKTDKQGRLTWNSAPDGELAFNFSATGYMRNDDVNVPADGTEHVITMHPGLTISGTVSDATTGQPIPRFRILTGWSEANPDGTTNFMWSTIDRFLLSFDGGTFHYTYEEPVVGGVKDVNFVFKFEADGYASAVSRVVEASEHAAEFDLALTPAVSTEVTVLSPDNRPVAGADVGLVSAGVRLSLVPGGLSHEGVQSSGSLLATDNQGHFTLMPDSSVTRVVIAGTQGYLDTTPAELAANPVIKLLPWGQIAGTYVSNSAPIANQDLALQYVQATTNFFALSCGFNFRTKTDSNGKFTFNMAPPGNLMVMTAGSFTDPSSGIISTFQAALAPVTVNPGETATVAIDAAGIARALQGLDTAGK